MTQVTSAAVVHSNLRAARINTTHSEGIQGDFIVIRHGDEEFVLESDSFFALADRLKTLDHSENRARYGDWNF